MPSIDNRIVAMSFDNAKFEAGVAKTLASLQKLNESLKNIGSASGLGNIEKAANRINFQGATKAISDLEKKLAGVGASGVKGLSDVQGASNKVSFGPLGTAIEGIKSKLSTVWHAPAAALETFKQKLNFRGAEAGLNNIESASNKVKFAGASQAAADLEKKLAFPGVEKSFANIEAASGKVKLGGINTAVQNVTKGFSIMQGAAAVALGNIASKAALAGGSMVKNLTVGPLVQGLKEYETNLNSIQTILANTQFQGSTLKDVNRALAELNKYSDQTIYNFSEMAKNIGTFTAAGVGLKESTAAIKGIANLAALSGSNSQQASTAMYQLSQAIASGRVSLQDWNSVVNAGMGGATFQRALAQTAQAMGTVAEGAVKIDKATGKATINGLSFRESITAKPGEESWLTSEVLTNTLSQFTGDLSKAELAAMGFNEAQIKSIQQTAITAKKAATEVKTLSGVYDVVKESIGSGWAKTFQTIFGDFEEAKTLFTGVTTAITDFVGKNADARNKVLGDWKELGGRTDLIRGIKAAFEALLSVIKPVKDAFREVFPPKTGRDLAELTDRFADFMERLKIGPETANGLRRTFAGFFAVLSIGKQIVTGIISVFGDLLGAATSGSGGILNMTGSLGDFLVKVDKTLKEGDGLVKFFDVLGDILSAPIKLLSDLAGALGSVFGSGGAADDVSSSVDGMTASLDPMTSLLENVGEAWEGFLDIIRNVGEQLKPLLGGIADAFGGLGDLIADGIRAADFDNVFDVIQTGLIGGIFIAIKRAIGGGLNINFGQNVLSNMSESFSALTGSLKAMQSNLQAKTLLAIAAAVGLLAAGVTALSMIDPKKLASSMTAISVGLGQLVAAMFILTKLGGTSFVTLPFIASSILILAAAMDVLAVAVIMLSKLSWNEIAKGLTGVGGSLVAMGIGLRAIPLSAPLIAAGLLPLAAAMTILALAVKVFSTMDWEGLAKGLVGVGGSLVAVGLGLRAMPTASLLVIGPGLIAVAVALNLLASAIGLFGNMDLLTLAKGIGGVGAALVVLGYAIKTIPPTVALQAAGLVLLSIALNGIGVAIGLLGNMSMKTIAKGISAIGAALLVLGVGLNFMRGTLPGSAALLAAAAALTLLAPAIGILGAMKWTTLVKGIAAMAAAIAALAIAGAVAGPGLTALGIAMIPLAAALALVGTSVYLVSTGLAKLGKDGAKNISALMLALTGLVSLIPVMVIKFVKGIVEILESIAALAPAIVESMVKIVNMLIDVVIKSAPKMAEAVIVLIGQFLRVLTESGPAIIEAGFKLLLALLSGINDNIFQVTLMVGQIIVKFLTAIAESFPKIVGAGLELLVQFLAGLASKMVDVVSSAAKVIVKFLEGITQNLPKVIKAGVDLLISFVKGITQNIGRLITAGADFIVSVLKGIGDNVGKVAKAAVDMVDKFFKAAVKAALDLADAGAKAVINFINGVADAIRKHAPELGKAGGNLGEAIIEGAITGMGSMAGEFVNRALSIFGQLPKAVKKFFGIKSPSTMFAEFGRNLMEGMSIGINENAPGVTSVIRSVTDDMANALSDSLDTIPDILDGLIDLDPVITPVMDLSNIEMNARRLADLTNVIPITAATSYNEAASISAAQEAAAQTEPDISREAVVKEIKFEQNNYSPESLSPIEVYRRTNNQLSQAKSVLGVA